MPGFTLNMAVDTLLKKEFDVYRAKGEPHPLMKENGVDAVPFQHKDLDIWRENFKGMQYHHKPTNLLITGAVDDVWQTPTDELIIVDYKATSTGEEITLNGKWKEAYKRQMEIYQWLFRQNGFKVQDTGYFVYVNARKDLPSFDGHLHFNIHLLAHPGDSSWVEPAIVAAKQCLIGDDLPESNMECEFCAYRRESRKYDG
ncbi:MAG: PD-(D/E)XK nuclease family protein [Deltaproteobacteria bacterium]|nr:PD-(D/E)XK nuclease family protein [Deltaproteobacteria bacterium]